MSNFDFLKDNHPELYQYATDAEDEYILGKDITLIKMRCFIEKIVLDLYKRFKLPHKKKPQLCDLLFKLEFINLVDNPIILQKFHSIRLLANKVAHVSDESIDKKAILSALNETFEIACWYCKSEGVFKEIPLFIEPKIVHNDIKKEIIPLPFQEENIQEELTYEPSNNVADTEDYQTFKTVSHNTIEASKKECISSKYIKLKDCFTEKLTIGQECLVEKLQEFLDNPNDHVFLLKGYAGTGKTFIVRGLTDYLAAIGRFSAIAAPTGKAARVIEDKTGKSASTIHSLIYNVSLLKEYKSQEGENGTETYRLYADICVNDNPANSVYIFDESSMISDDDSEAEFIKFGSGFLLRDLFKFINLDVNDHEKKIIFIGDTAQLPPVNNAKKIAFSPALNEEYLEKNFNVSCKSYTLTDVVRQKEKSGILKNTKPIREALEKASYGKLEIDDSFNDVKKIDNFLETFKQIYNNDIKNLQQCISLAQTNARTSELNQIVRKYLYPNAPFYSFSDTPSYFKNKTQAQIKDKIIVTCNSYVNEHFIPNGDFGCICEIEDTEKHHVTLKNKNEKTKIIEEIPIDLYFRKMCLIFKSIQGETFKIKAYVFENLLYNDNAQISSDEARALYIDFKKRYSHIRVGTPEFKDALRKDPYFNAMKIKFGYAITCHKSQGSEWDNVIVDCQTEQNKRTADYFRWLYTAMTRAKTNLYMLNAPNEKLGSNIKFIKNPGI